MTLFCGYFQSAVSGLIYGILDNFLLDGWSALYRISLAILRMLEPQLLLLNDIGKISKRFHAFKMEDNCELLVIAWEE